MLEIKPCFDVKKIAPYCKKHGVPPSEAHFLYVADNSGEIVAAGLFEVKSNAVRAVLYESAEPDDTYLFDGILRAGFHYASSQGIETGVIPEYFRDEHAAYFAHLNYPPETELNIVNFFSKYKNCK